MHLNNFYYYEDVLRESVRPQNLTRKKQTTKCRRAFVGMCADRLKLSLLLA